IGAEPTEVAAYGALSFYGPSREERGERCLTCAYRDHCEFYFDITESEFNKEYYHDAESVDGYYRDQCVFSSDTSIYDTLSLSAKYDSGALLTYSLSAYSPYEGWKLIVNGTEGRLEAERHYSGSLADEPHDDIRIFRPDGEVVRHRIPKSPGSHSGGDARLRTMLFGDNVPDPLNQQAGTRAGALSMLLGTAANLAIAEGRLVRIEELWKAGERA
ncbi:hypothetical protein, partial [Mycobacterium tuberculosis]